MTITPEDTRRQIIAFRLQGHHLAERLPRGSFAEAAACGIQNSPPGSAALAFHARVADFTLEDLERAVTVDQSLLQIWCMRSAPYFVPTRDAPVFTAGLLPEDEEALHAFIFGAAQHLDLFGWSATQAVERTAAALVAVLDGLELDKDSLGVELARRMEPLVDPEKLALWRSPDGYGANTYGETLARFALNGVALHGLFCIAPRSRNAATFLLTREWLRDPLASVDPQAARGELVRRYLAGFGPSTPERFASWAGISPAQAGRAWKLVEDELAAVNLGGRKAWLNGADLPRYEAPVEPQGVRLLPPHDPYLALRDRETVLPDKKVHAQVWRFSGNPGAILVDGEFAGTWRPQKKGKRLGIAVSAFAEISKPVKGMIEEEAVALGPLRGCETVEVEFIG